MYWKTITSEENKSLMEIIYTIVWGILFPQMRRRLHPTKLAKWRNTM